MNQKSHCGICILKKKKNLQKNIAPPKSFLVINLILSWWPQAMYSISQCNMIQILYWTQMPFDYKLSTNVICIKLYTTWAFQLHKCFLSLWWNIVSKLTKFWSNKFSYLKRRCMWCSCMYNVMLIDRSYSLNYFLFPLFMILQVDITLYVFAICAYTQLFYLKDSFII